MKVHYGKNFSLRVILKYFWHLGTHFNKKCVQHMWVVNTSQHKVPVSDLSWVLSVWSLHVLPVHACECTWYTLLLATALGVLVMQVQEIFYCFYCFCLQITLPGPQD